MENEDVLHNTAPQIITEDEEATLSQATGALGPNAIKTGLIGYGVCGLAGSVLATDHVMKEVKERGTSSVEIRLEGLGIATGYALAGGAAGAVIGHAMDRGQFPPRRMAR
jgi:hypothetical protein